MDKLEKGTCVRCNKINIKFPNTESKDIINNKLMIKMCTSQHFMSLHTR